MADISRIEKEMNSLTKSENIPVNKVERINGNDLIWKVVFDGPIATAYEYGIFTLKFIFPLNYPIKGPEARFMTKIIHPNVTNEDQHICINLLNNWSPDRTIEDVMIGIFDIMINPSPEDGYNNEGTKLLKSDPDAFYDKTEEYTELYAKNEI